VSVNVNVKIGDKTDKYDRFIMVYNKINGFKPTQKRKEWV